jgi:hypothetical protein
MVRPSLRSATAFIVGSAASGYVPASVLDDDSFDLSLDGGEGEGSDCFLTSFSEVFSTNTRDLCVIFISYGVLCNCLYCHRCFQPLLGHSSFFLKKTSCTTSLLYQGKVQATSQNLVSIATFSAIDVLVYDWPHRFLTLIGTTGSSKVYVAPSHRSVYVL